MFTFEVIMLLILAFFLGSVFNTLLISRMYEHKAVEEEIKSTQNRGEHMNGLSIIKNMSTKRFYRSIASLILVLAVIATFVLSYEFAVYDNWISLVVLGVFIFYVLIIEKTISLINIPIFRMWKAGAPKRKEKKEYRKTKKAAEEAQKKYEESKKDEGLYIKPKPDYVKPPQPTTKKIIVSVEDEEEAK